MSVLQQDPAAPQQPTAPSASPDVKVAENMIPKARLDEVIAQRDAANKKADALEKAQQDAEKKRLEEANQYKELYEKTQAELSNLKPKAEQVDDYEKTLAELLSSQIEELPEEFRDVVPDGLTTKQKLDWLAKNKSKFMKSDPFDIGAGKKGVKPDKHPELSAEELQVAKSFRMTPEDYAKFKK